MFCKDCGQKIAENSKFCRFCGSKVEPLEENETKEDVTNQEVKEEQPEDNKSIELTDNIDVTKIVVETDKEYIEEKKEEGKTQDFEEVLNDINNSIDKMNDEIPSPGETQSAKDKGLDPEKEIKNILEEFNNDEMESNKEEQTVIEPVQSEPDLEKTSVIVDGNIVTAVESVLNVTSEEKTNSEPQSALDANLNNDNKVNVNNDNIVTINNDDIKNNNNNTENNETLNTDIPTSNVVNSIYSNDSINEEEQKESKHIVLPIILSILIVILLAGLVYMYMMYSKSQDKIDNIEKDNKFLEEKIKQVESQEPVKEEKTKFYLEGYEIALPNTKEVAYTNNSLLINVDDTKIYTYIKKDEKYSNIKSSMWKNKSIIESDEYKVVKYGTKVVSSREYVVYEIESTKGNKYLVAYSDINGKDVVAFVISNKDNNVDSKKLTMANYIADSLKENKNIVDSKIKIFN